MKNILLTSYFAGTTEYFKKFMSNFDLKNKDILFIDTASNVEEYTRYVSEAHEALSNLNYIVSRLDVAHSNILESRTKIENANIIYIAGGNTFYLLEKLKELKLDRVLIDKINSGTPYVGESAGAIILAPNITYIQKLDDPSFAPNLKDYSGLGVFDFSVLPHYLDIPFQEETKYIFDNFHDQLKLVPINNHETLSILNDKLINN